MTHRILILGGTFEARRLAGLLARRGVLDVTVSLAGRTKNPAEHPVPVRTGGFGGAEGLARYLREEGIALLVDATHPYAAMISRNAAEAARHTGVAMFALRRPTWVPKSGDRWTEVADVPAAVHALGPEPRHIFVTLGRQELAPFEAAPQHRYLVRSVDPVEPPLALPRVEYLLGRGPFEEAAEKALLADKGIDVVVSKNSGGTASYAKIAAARGLGIEVVILRRPELPDVPVALTPEEAVAMADHALALPEERGV